MSSLNKINRYLYELTYRDKFDILNLPFDELVEKLALMNEEDRTEITELLDSETKKKITEIIEGGIL